jgi:hypothetical protein
MKKLLRISVLVVAVLMAFSAPSQARGGHHGWGWGPALGVGLLGIGLWELSRPHYYYRYYPYPAPVVQVPAQEIYVQPAPQQPAGYWYYCQEAGAYYPYVRQCPNGWMKVVPSPPPPQ